MILAAFAMGIGAVIPLLAGAAIGKAQNHDTQGLWLIGLAVLGVGILRAI